MSAWIDKWQIIGVGGILVTVVVALWQNKRARKAEERLDNFMRDLPRQLARGLHAIGSAFEAGTSPGQIPVPDERVGGGSFVTSNADVDHDGRDELLVQYPIGAHGTALQVFGWRGDEFNQIGQLSVGTPAGFKVEDYDGDGRLEIVTHETDWSLGLPYALAPHESIWYRWDGQDFKEISRAKDYASDEVEDLLRDHSGG